MLRPVRMSVVPRFQIRHQSSVPAAKVLKNSKGESVVTTQTNDNFETFFQRQRICASQEEYQQFLGACRRGLPSVFRVILTKPQAGLILKQLRNGIFAEAGLQPVTWYPDNNTWKFDNTRWDMKEEERLIKYHKILNAWKCSGSIYRQEQVSMVPVACLDVQPHHTVLDMCASPGSKTGQVLEAMQSGLAPGQLPSGLVVANEPDMYRCRTLIGNMKSIPSPCLLVTNYKGESFPDLKNADGSSLQYDRIVCDVPCSGDGTIRKNPNVWTNWHPGRGNERNHIQLKIARRGVQLLKVGGLMAYSSCAINQIENECVIAQLLEESGGGLELVDMRGKFRGLHFEPGLDEWRVMDSRMTEYTRYSQVPVALRGQIRPTMFPSANTKNLNLDRSLRLLPHHNDDGGFFVAILRKTRHFETMAADCGCSKPVKAEGKRVRHKDGSREPFVDLNLRKLNSYKQASEDHLANLNEVYGCDLNAEHLVAPDGNTTPLHLISDRLGQLMRRNGDIQGIAPGCRILHRERRKTAISNLRFVSGSLHLISDRIKKRKFELDLPDFRSLLSADSASCRASFSAALQRDLAQLGHGEVVFQLAGQDKITVWGFLSGGKVDLHLDEASRFTYSQLLQ